MNTFEEAFTEISFLNIGKVYHQFTLVKMDIETVNNIIEYTLYFRGYGNVNLLLDYLEILNYPEVLLWNYDYYYCWMDNIIIDSITRDEVIILSDGYYRKVLGLIK